MAGYLNPNNKDYIPAIQLNNLYGVLGQQLWLLPDAEDTALDEATGLLKQKYDIGATFQVMVPWNPETATYQPTNRVYLDGPAYDPTSTYAIGALTLYQGAVYIATAASADPAGAFVPANWSKLGNQNDLFFVPYPPGSSYGNAGQPVVWPFQFDRQYAVNDLVYWHGVIYKCLKQTQPLGQETEIQFDTYQNLPLLNIDPENVNVGFQYWANLGPYELPASTPLTNATYWKAGDNRGPRLKRAIVDMALYYVHYRVDPKNVAESRHIAYKDAIKFLENSRGGEIDTCIVYKQPTQGLRIRYGGPIKNQNSY